MTIFPKERIFVTSGRLYGQPGDVSIQLDLKDLSLPGIEQSRVSIHLDCINIPSIVLSDLAGKTFSFPTNPDIGYIDGSVYIEHAHHPVDVTEIAFGVLDAEAIEIALQSRFLLSFEGLHNHDTNEEYEDFEITLHAKISTDA